MTRLRIVSENSKEDMARKRAEEALTLPLLELAANIIRIVRGAGSPERLLSQMQQVMKVASEFRELHDASPPSWTIQNILALTSPYEKISQPVKTGDIAKAALEGWESDSTNAEEDVVRDICRAALQISASILLRQNTQERTAEHSLHFAARQLEDIKKKRRRQLNRHRRK
jgi:hypothetical protein